MSSHWSSYRATLGLSAILVAGMPSSLWPQNGTPTKASTTNGSTTNGSPRSAGADSVTVVASSRYKAGGLHRRLLGDGYRDLWATPIRVPVLDLKQYAGGLKPTKTGGGAQTKTLRFDAPNGQEFVFRPVYKALLLDLEGYDGTIIKDLFADALSASHPTAPLIAEPLLEATGVLHPKPVLVMMPDDERLGEFRKEFAGKLGTIEEFPNVPDDAPGFAGAVDIIDSDELLERLNKDPRVRIDAQALLNARLVDMLLGDNDRHPGQWKWARLADDKTSPWVPIARDRDKVFVSHDGMLLRLARLAHPNLVSFEHIYPTALFKNAIEFDRRLLVGLDRAAWDSTAVRVARAINDSVIDAALAATPPEYHNVRPELAAKVRSRRSQLLRAADTYYRTLFADPDLHATDVADRATITRLPDGSVDVAIQSGSDTPYFRRRFAPGESREIRLYLHEGNDTAVVRGHVPRSIPVRVIGGNGINTFIDSSTVAGRVQLTDFYDKGGVNDVRYGVEDSGSTDIWNRRPLLEAYGQLVAPQKDRGKSLKPVFGIKRGRGLGFTPVVGVSRTVYGFRAVPYRSKARLEIAYATRLKGFELQLETDNRFEESPYHIATESQWSEIDVSEFRGFGNDVPNLVGDFYRVQQRQWLFNPSIGYALGPTSDISLGPIVKHTTTDSLPNRFISEERPYGFGSFGQAGLQLRVLYETPGTGGGGGLVGEMKQREYEQRGFQVEITGAAYPAMWDATSAFGKVSAVGVTYVTIPVLTNPILAFRAGGEKLFGDFPYFESAFLGGSHSLRMMRRQRLAGDASLHGSAELRLPVARFPLILPLNVGLIGLADVGRVYLNGESPGGWHTGVAGGFWLGAFNPGSHVHVLFSNSRERRIRLGLGFDY